MAVLEPQDGDGLDALFSQLSDIEEPGDVIEVTGLSDVELLGEVRAIEKRLSQLESLLALNPNTQEARELHSRRGALMVEAAKRNLR